MSYEFRLIEPAEMTTIIPLLMELDPAIPEETLHQRLPDMLEAGYECLGIYADNELIGICGFWILAKYYVGKHLEPDNVYIRPQHRGHGLGNKLDDWLQATARARGCLALELNCYIKNEAGLKFWEHAGYHRLGIHFRKKLPVVDD